MPTDLHTVALVEDDELLRKTVAESLAASPRWNLTGIYPDAEAALDGMKTACPEVVLMDIQLPGMSGIECVAKLKEFRRIATRYEKLAGNYLAMLTLATTVLYLRLLDSPDRP